MAGGNGIAVLACSPRAGGNTDAAATILAREMDSALIRLRDHMVLPCLSCGACAAGPEAPCPQRRRDTSAPLFSLLGKTEALVLVSPIYFYHVPAQLKALMDRSQPWWAGKRAAPGKKIAYPVLVAAREQGENIFTGSLLSLRCWLHLFGYTLAPPLTLRGLDEAGALADSPTAREAVVAYASQVRQGDWSGGGSRAGGSTACRG